MVDSLSHQWQYVPSIRGCSLFDKWQYGIIRTEDFVVSQATVCVWADDAIAPCKEWDVAQLCYFMDSIMDEEDYDASTSDSTATLMSRLQTIQHYSHFLHGTSDL